MGYRPPKGLRPPQLEGKRTGRPKGSKNYARARADAWADVFWGYEHRYHDRASPPTPTAWLWWSIACRYPDEVGEWLEAWGQL